MKLLKNPYVIGFLVGAALLTAYRFLATATLRAPAPIADLGAWTLVDQDGAAFGSQQLAGDVYVASFFFTRCPTVCPSLMDKQKRMQKAVADLGDEEGESKVRFLAITVDPAHDTPAVLKDYAGKLGADPARWTFLTGDRAVVEDLLVKRMMVGVGEQKPGDLFDIAHSTRFALVDQKGRLRALWPTEEEQLGNLINAARLLANEGPDV